MWFRRFILSSFSILGGSAIAQTVIVVQPLPASSSTDAMAVYRNKTQLARPCDRSGDAIVVCGSKAERNARERLPLPRAPVEGGRPPKGEVQRASSAPVKQGSCGVVGGQGAGCVGGLPLLGAAILLGKAVQGIIDPDADLSPPPPLPDQFRGAGHRP